MYINAMMLHFLISRVGEHNMGIVKEVERMRRVSGVERMEMVKGVEEAIVKIR